MFREMRRKRQQLTEAECVEILTRNTSGVLAVLGDDEYPYAVPISYVYEEKALYFHCARSGHKIDAIKSSNKVSFCVIDQDDVVPQQYTTHFRSVIIFGRASIVDDDDEMRTAIEKLANKYNPTDSEANRDIVIKKEYALLRIVRIDIDHLTGKEAIELVKSKNMQR